MSRLLSIEEICERALRKIGALGIRSSGARPEEVKETRYWLDMVMGHEASRQRTWWLVSSAKTINLLPGNPGPYDLTAALGPTQAPEGIQFVVGAVLLDTTLQQDIHELPMVRHQEWERRNLGPDLPPAVGNPNNLEGGSGMALPPLPPGIPEYCFVDRAQKPTFSCYPAPGPTSTLGVRLLFQGFPTDFTASAPADRTYKLRTAWNLWVVTATAAQIGNGPVRKLPADEVRDMKQEAQSLRDDLEAYENQEQANEPRLVSYYDGV